MADSLVITEFAALLARVPCYILDFENTDDIRFAYSSSQHLNTLLRLKTEHFYTRDERAVTWSAAQDLVAAMLALDRTTPQNGRHEKYKMLETRGPFEHCAFALRSGFSSDGACVAIYLSGGHASDAALIFQLDPPSDAAAHALVAQLGASQALDLHVYHSPQSAPQQPDSFWGEQWLDTVVSADFPQYQAYRQGIDPLVESAIQEYGMTEDGGRARILEISAGDGALAQRVLQNLGDGVVERYVLVERNAELAAHARRRLAGFPTAKVLQGDAVDANTYTLASEGGHGAATFSLCLSIGSVLCSQVGLAREAEDVLRMLYEQLDEGGTLIATGISASFLHPAIIQRAGFEAIVRGSYPSSATKCTAAPRGIEHAWGRFQFVVLRKTTSHSNPAEAALFRALADG